MTWLGLRDNSGSMLFDASGLIGPSAPAHGHDDFLPTGTLVLEFLNEPSDTRRNLIRFATREPWHSSLRISIDPDGSLHLMTAQGSQTLHHTLPTNLQYFEGAATLWYTWDAPARIGTLALQTADQVIFQTDIPSPQPMSVRDADRICTHPTQTEVGYGVSFHAISDRVEPIGPWARMGRNTKIETPKGLVPISAIKPGDLVLTADDDITQVRWVGWQVLPARGQFGPLAVRSPFFGASEDVVTAPTQLIELGGSKVEYLIGQEHVFAQVGHIVDGKGILQCAPQPLVLYYDILLDTQAVLNISGVRMTSYDPSVLLDDPDTLQKSILRNIPKALLPKASVLSSPLLREFEAINVCL